MLNNKKIIDPSFEDFGDNYDSLFDNPSKLADLDASSIDAVLKPRKVKTILDCACGTGIPSIGLARLGYLVSVSDISPKLISILGKKTKKEGLSIERKVADFTNLNPWKTRKFDAVINPGNSIPLVTNIKTVKSVIDSMTGVTKNGGMVIIVIHNYSKLQKQNQNFLLRKIYQDKKETRIIFDIRKFALKRTEVKYISIEITNKPKTKLLTKSYLNIKPEALIRMMGKAGLRKIKLLDLITLKRFSPDKHEWFMAIGEKLVD
jgi:ubiquinone/menaquinone biosynthesis C-methylase UbiE